MTPLRERTTDPREYPVAAPASGVGARVTPLLAPLVAIAICVLGYLFVLRPAAERVQQLRARAAAVGSGSALVGALDAYTRAHADIGTIPPERIAALTALAPAGEDVPGLFAAIDAAAQRTGVSVTSIEVTREDAPVELHGSAGKKVLAIGVGVRNVDYPKLKAFLDVLAASQRLLDVLSVQFTAQSLGANIRLRAYTIDS